MSNMVFGRKKRMIDVGELQRQGRIQPTSGESTIPTNNEGFIELGQSNVAKPAEETPNTPTPNMDFFNVSTTTETATFSEEANGYSKREVDAKMQELDNKLYKMEQRIELLERKAGVNEPVGNGSVIGW